MLPSRKTCVLISLFCGLFHFSSAAYAQEGAVVCDAARLAEGNRLFDEVGVMPQVVAWLEPCLPSGFPEGQQKEGAHRLMILAYYEMGDEENREKWVLSLLDINRRYQTPPTDPKDVQNMIIALRPKAWHQRWLYRGLIIGVVAGTAAYFAFRPEDSVPLKPLPPGPPGQ